MKDNSTFTNGLNGLKKPIIPLVRIIQFLYLTGPFETIAEILDELIDPIETNAVVYSAPKKALSPYLDILEAFQCLNPPKAAPPSFTIFDQNDNAIETMEAIALWVSHHMLRRELERINSQLCGPCGCDLCCVGPSNALKQDFFEIPLTTGETDLFPLTRVDTPETRQRTPYAQTPTHVNHTPFYQGEPKLMRWKSGWSLILPKETSCPQLDQTKSICRIYPQRPDVCRRPQIFPYLLEPKNDGTTQQEAYTLQNKILAIWDCPYVKAFQAEIAAYAEMCELEPIFKKNKE